ncbi:uncharacterized protein RCO7_09568 [Rhynchosporium graminicola]|uniref:Uncharacterized protein n=1 Tax=Rhynchosporium graminicola TaxID=2792576 RepID=A0A1E1LC91_9HELO|nr:uncharacterized protein RCO7_09568 [Rhynchosporium commune]
MHLLCIGVTASPHHGRPVQPATNINPPQNNNQTGKNDNPSIGSPTTSINLSSKKKLPANNNRNSENLDPSLIPIFSIRSGTGVGANGVAIPNTCPPARGDFISKMSANIAAGNVLGIPITFNTDPKVQDIKTNKARATAMIITLQSFSGVKGVGCPGASTPELISQQQTGVVVSK